MSRRKGKTIDLMASLKASLANLGGCHAGADGECNWPECPQERDGEPTKSGRTCPLPWGRDEDDRAESAASLPVRQGPAPVEQPTKEAPQPPFEVTIRLRGEDWDYITRHLDRLAAHIVEHGPDCSEVSGGGGGSHYVNIVKRDVTAEAYREELDAWWKLDAWCKRQSAPRSEPSEGMTPIKDTRCPACVKGTYCARDKYCHECGASWWDAVAISQAPPEDRERLARFFRELEATRRRAASSSPSESPDQ